MAYDPAGVPYYRPFRLLSNTAVTSIEMTTEHEDLYQRAQINQVDLPNNENPIVNDSSVVSGSDDQSKKE